MTTLRTTLYAIIAATFVGAFGAAPAQAQALGAGIETEARQALLMDDTTGTVLLAKNADEPMHPSSMSKLMTVYMVFEKLAKGELKLDDQFGVSERAWRQGGSKMFVQVGSRVNVDDLLKGVIVQSGNDACIVLAEGLAGSEGAFADAMTRRARELGLTNSVFKNSTGWPDPQHLMTARDLAVLSRRIIHDFPQYYHYFGQIDFTYNNIKQGNRNPLLYKNLGVDGLKTGHTDEGGYGLTASAKRGDRRLILVVNGLTSMNERSREPERLLDWGFREFDNYALFKAGDKVDEADVWLGDQPKVPLVLEHNLVLTLPKAARKDLKAKLVYDGPVPAPIKQGMAIGHIEVSAPGMETVQVPLVAAADVGRLGFTGRLAAAFNYLVWGPTRR
ncbi:MAG TPA: D-alanyl-D-alanine carboxypeptidase family protein [Candidatus Cybelea sp.]|nr:D-alanyl-D-alanine carboxypeptidase family protein [Candidatus Cybelea sp.]